MTLFSLLPAALSILLMAAHLTRAGHRVLVLGTALSLFLLLVRQGWSRRTLQLIMLASAAEWVRVLVELIGVRKADGMPYLRMSVIIGSVVAFAVISALLLGTRRSVRYFTP
ncbi:MAG: hypothetical protein QUS14_00905 [Pyrinomonadaceae bacterium]|nr:hypothetical protein [Pyrinomonadaceae bacterium]